VISSSQEDQKLIQKYRLGDVKAFNCLYEKYKQKIVKVLVFKGLPREDALDVCQDIFLNLIDTLKKTVIKESFNAFLNQIIRNKVVDFYRKKKYNLLYILFIDALEPEQVDNNNFKYFLQGLSDNHLELEKKIELEDAIDYCLKRENNERWKLLLTLWLDGLKREQIAELSGVPFGSVCSGISRARPPFLECLVENYFRL